VTAAATRAERRERVRGAFLRGLAAATALLLVLLQQRAQRLPDGVALHRQAWAAGFEERGLPVPEEGPADGWWSTGLPEQVPDAATRRRMAQVDLGARVRVDARGLRHAASAGAPRGRVLVVGASVAFGVAASLEARTYFAELARLLGERGHPVVVDVLSAGGWSSREELAGLRDRGLDPRPDVVVLLDGLNDVLLEPGDGPARVRAYLERVRAMRDLAAAAGARVVLARQPCLLGKRRSPLEARIAAVTPELETLAREWPNVAAGLAALAAEAPATTTYADTSGCFDGEEPTTFCDVWHFPDPGQRLLAEALAATLAPLLP
jgi:lysophospholipase L1-like esterase